MFDSGSSLDLTSREDLLEQPGLILMDLGALIVHQIWLPKVVRVVLSVLLRSF